MDDLKFPLSVDLVHDEDLRFLLQVDLVFPDLSVNCRDRCPTCCTRNTSLIGPLLI